MHVITNVRSFTSFFVVMRHSPGKNELKKQFYGANDIQIIVFAESKAFFLNSLINFDANVNSSWPKL